MSVILGKDEKIVCERNFKPSLIFFWLKANYVLTDKRLTGSQPNVIFNIFPLGKEQVNQPLKTIASVNSGTKFFFKKFLVGLGLAILGWYLIRDDSTAGGIIFLLWGLYVLLNSYMSTFIIMNTGGQKVGYSLSWIEKSKVQQFVNDINTVIADL